MKLELENPTEMLVAARLAHGGRDWPASYGAFTRASETGPATSKPCPSWSPHSANTVRSSAATRSPRSTSGWALEPAGVCDGGAPNRLTKREPDIIGRIAVGDSNREVAKQLYVSEKTVSRHLANIYGKLGVSSRTAAVAWAHRHDVL